MAGPRLPPEARIEFAAILDRGGAGVGIGSVKGEAAGAGGIDDVDGTLRDLETKGRAKLMA